MQVLAQENPFSSSHFRAGSEGWRICVAPMIDVTDRHCRYFHRLLAPHVRLYTEMITTGAIEFGNRSRLLDFNAAEHPVALQLGGSEPAALAASARAGQQWGYDEINLNCGCPSERVQKGAFGACLMAEASLVADCIKAMQDAVTVPVTVKHRLGLDYDESYDMVRDFVGTLYQVGCRVFIVHARNAVLKGLSPKDNREKPPLRYSMAEQLRHDFPKRFSCSMAGLPRLSNRFHCCSDSMALCWAGLPGTTRLFCRRCLHICGRQARCHTRRKWCSTWLTMPMHRCGKAFPCAWWSGPCWAGCPAALGPGAGVRCCLILSI